MVQLNFSFDIVTPSESSSQEPTDVGSKIPALQQAIGKTLSQHCDRHSEPALSPSFISTTTWPLLQYIQSKKTGD